MGDVIVGNSLRQSSQKAAHAAIDSIRLLMEERGRNKSSRQDGALKRPAIGSPQVLERSTSDPLYVLVPGCESSGTDDSVTCLEVGEEVAPTAANDTARLEEMDRAQSTCARLNKMCKRFNRSMAMGLAAIGHP